jgi:hypothetical protein
LTYSQILHTAIGLLICVDGRLTASSLQATCVLCYFLAPRAYVTSLTELDPRMGLVYMDAFPFDGRFTRQWSCQNRIPLRVFLIPVPQRYCLDTSNLIGHVLTGLRPSGAISASRSKPSAIPHSSGDSGSLDETADGGGGTVGSCRLVP